MNVDTILMIIYNIISASERERERERKKKHDYNATKASER